MFRRGSKDDDEDDLNSLRGDFTGIEDDELGVPLEDDEEATAFLNDVAPAGGNLDDDERPRRSRRRLRAPGQVGVIGGFFRVIGMALVALVIFLLIGVGIAVGASALGAIRLLDMSAINVPEIVILPTSAPVEAPTVEAPPTVETGAAVVVEPTVPAPVPTATPPDAVVIVPTPTDCLDLTGWWDQQDDTYQFFANLSIESPPNTLLATLQQMRVRRDNARSAVVTPCVAPIRNAFVAGYDLLISSFETISTGGDVSAARGTNLMAGQAFAQGLAGLWGAGIATEGSPTGIEVGSAATCGAARWYGAAQTQRSAFVNAYTQVDPATMQPREIRQSQNTMQAAYDNVVALNTPACAAEPSRLLLAYMDDLINALQMRLGNNAAEAGRLTSAQRNLILLDAWLRYLGLAP